MGEMTRREKAMRAAMRLKGRYGDEDPYVIALAEEYDDLLAFLDAMENDGLIAAYQVYNRYCEAQ